MAQELELKVESNKYQARISTLEGYLVKLENLVQEYTTMKDRVSDFLDESDDNFADAQTAAQIGIDRCQKAIEATKANIESIQKIMDDTANVGSNVKKILDAAVEAASAGMFD